MAENTAYIFSLSPYLRTDVVTLKNTVDLDNKNSDDTTTYIGLDYSLGFNLKSKDEGPQAFLKLERNGPYDYDAPVFIHNTLRTSAGRVENYDQEDLFPQVEEFWLELPLYKLPLSLKSGLFAYDTEEGLNLYGSYENYGFNLYSQNKGWQWHFYYFKPDLVNKNHLGPRIKMEKDQGIDYEHSKAHFFALDVTFSKGEHTFKPHASLLFDRTNNKRTNLFSTPTHNDKLGVFGMSWSLKAERLSVGVEADKNFGKAKSSDEAYKDVEHTGYLIYAKASYSFRRFTPHSRFCFASGNKVTTEMIDNQNSRLPSGKNRAFSVYSPFNTSLADSIYPEIEAVPLVAMGGGNGLNYGINRPTTFAEARLLENLVLLGFGFDYQLTDKLTFAFDWWHLNCAERGVGTFNGSSKKLPSELGNEIDLSFNYDLNKNTTLSLLSGYFSPGKYYREKRDDTGGTSLFSPFVRGDGNAHGAYQVELSLTLNF